MMKKISLVGLLLLTFSPFSEAQLFQSQLFDAHTGTQQKEHALPEQGAAIQNKLLAYIDEAQTLSGTFDQTVYSSRGQEKSSGTFQLKRPGMFAWHFNQPDEQEIVSDGHKVFQYDVGLEQVIIRSRSEVIGGSAMDLLVGKQKLSQLFTIDGSQNAKMLPAVLIQSFPKDYFFRLSPKKKTNDLEQAWLVSDAQGQLKAIYLDAGTGQKTVIQFNQVQRNQVISDQAFHFSIPKGVDVIGDAH